MEIKFFSLISQQTIASDSTEKLPFLPAEQVILLYALNDIELFQQHRSTLLKKGGILLATGPLDISLRKELICFSGIIYTVNWESSIELTRWMIPIADPQEQGRVHQLLDHPLRSIRDIDELETYIRSYIHAIESKGKLGQIRWHCSLSGQIDTRLILVNSKTL